MARAGFRPYPDMEDGACASKCLHGNYAQPLRSHGSRRLCWESLKGKHRSSNRSLARSISSSKSLPMKTFLSISLTRYTVYHSTLIRWVSILQSTLRLFSTENQVMC